MKSPAHHAKLLDDLLARDRRYPMHAYGFVLSTLNATISKLPQPRHISGQELAEGFRHCAMDQFGPMARAVLDAWNISSTEDIGRVVFNLIDIGLLTKNPEDRPEDFQRLYSFEDAFNGPYPYVN